MQKLFDRPKKTQNLFYSYTKNFFQKTVKKKRTTELNFLNINKVGTSYGFFFKKSHRELRGRLNINYHFNYSHLFIKPFITRLQKTLRLSYSGKPQFSFFLIFFFILKQFRIYQPKRYDRTYIIFNNIFGWSYS